MRHDVRSRLVAATAELMDVRGPLKVRVEDIAERAGCSRATLYRHVSDKDELVREVILNRVIAMADIVMHQTEGIDDPTERVAQGMLLFSDALRSERWYKVLRAEVHDTYPISRVGGGIEALTVMVAPMVEQTLREYADSGYLREDLDPHDAVEWLVGIQLSLLEPFARRSREHRIAILKRYAIYPLIKPLES